MNNRIAQLQDYPFTRLRALTADTTGNPELDHIALSLGEPKHAPPDFVIQNLTNPAALAIHLASYPATRGSDELRNAISAWTLKRFGARTDPESQILPVNGTREALFSFAQALLSGASNPVLMPNPFYQIYEGAALLAGAEPFFVNNDPSQNYRQDLESIDDATWDKAELIYVCTPGNPTGQAMPDKQMQWLISKAIKHNFIIAADECYAEIYPDESAPPTGFLEACTAMGNDTYSHCVVFHSLSKRSNLAGLRSGFVAGDAALLRDYLQYRTYHGCAMSTHHQAASVLAWQDESHVVANRALYRAKFAAVEQILAPHIALNQSDGGFYHWIRTPITDTEFCLRLFEEQHVTVLPGQFLGRSGAAPNPGENHVRVAWVSPIEQCQEAAQRIASFLTTLD